MKVFLDTNVLFSAFATRGLCADLLRLVLTEHELIVGEVVIVELRRALAQRVGVPLDVVDEIEQFLRGYSVVPDPASAAAGGADALVTGDADLLTAGARFPIPVLTPRQSWRMLRGDLK